MLPCCPVLLQEPSHLHPPCIWRFLGKTLIFDTSRERKMRALFLGGGSEGEEMTVTDETTAVCTFGAGGERLQYRMHFWTESHNTPKSMVYRQAWFRLASLTQQQGQQRFRELHPHYSDG